MKKEKKTRKTNAIRLTEIQYQNWQIYLKLNDKTEANAIRAYITDCIDALPRKLKKSKNASDSKNREVEEIWSTMEFKR